MVKVPSGRMRPALPPKPTKPPAAASAGVRLTMPPESGTPLESSAMPEIFTVRTGCSAKFTFGCSCPMPSVTRCASATLPVPG